MKGFVIAAAAVGLAILALIIGVAAQSPGWMLVWFCLHPFALFALGRTSLAFTRGRRLTLVDEMPSQ